MGQAKSVTSLNFLEIGNRIIEIQERYRYSGAQFAKRLKVTPATLSRYRNGRDIPSGVLQRILELHPEIDGDWLLTGRGGMMRSEVEPSLAQPPADSDHERRLSYLVDRLIELEKAAKDAPRPPLSDEEKVLLRLYRKLEPQQRADMLRTVSGSDSSATAEAETA